MTPLRPTWLLRCWSLLAGVTLVSTAIADRGDVLSPPPSWQPPSFADTKDQVLPWLLARAADETAKAELEALWSTEPTNLSPAAGQELCQRVLTSLARVDSRASELLQICQNPRPAHDLPALVVLQDTELPTWASANLRFAYGAWLADQQLYDEAHEQLASLGTGDVCDPAALLFYQSVTAHRRLERERCLATLDKLLENSDILPRRYVTVSKLMQADLGPLKPDSLDEISRLMDSIKVRLGHGRAGTRVREEEDAVIAKLDKLIEKLEEQASQSSAAQASQGAGGPSAPMQDSMPGGGTGPGNVNPKDLGANTDWGNLPPKEREEALQELSKDLPSHFRDVIEEYFRKLAREKSQP